MKNMGIAILEDGKTKVVVKNKDETFYWLLRNQSHSTDWALKHGGYSLKKTKRKPTVKFVTRGSYGGFEPAKGDSRKKKRKGKLRKRR